MSTDKRDPYNIECGKRLVIARTALGYPGKAGRRAWAKLTMPDETQEDILRSRDLLRKYENGDTLVRPAYVAKLKRLFGVDPNWIYSNDPSRLPGDLNVKVLELQEAGVGESEEV